MNKSYLTAVLTMACLLWFGISARAQDTEGVRVKVPFEFVAGGATLPAGTYSVGRRSLEPYSSITIIGYGHNAVVLPIAIGGPSGEEPTLSFVHVGDKYVLSKANTPAGSYFFALPQAMGALAQRKDQGTTSSGGTN